MRWQPCRKQRDDNQEQARSTQDKRVHGRNREEQAPDKV